MPRREAGVIIGCLHRFARAFGAFLFPGRCVACGHLYRLDLAAGRHHDPASFAATSSRFLCPRCAGDFTPVGSPLCVQCGRPFQTAQGPDHLCGDCLAAPFVFDCARSAGLYYGGLRALIHNLKYKGCIQSVRPLASLLWHCVNRHWQPGTFDWIIPVPLHPKRLRQRGFNQAFQLLRQWRRLSERYNIVFDPDCISDHLVVRNQFTSPQTGLNKKQRKANVKNAFFVTKPSAVENKSILIVDDVFTTGSTANACAASLVKAGAKSVCVATLAVSA